jgi:hypothetical protein
MAYVDWLEFGSPIQCAENGTHNAFVSSAQLQSRLNKGDRQHPVGEHPLDEAGFSAKTGLNGDSGAIEKPGTNLPTEDTSMGEADADSGPADGGSMAVDDDGMELNLTLSGDEGTEGE